MIKLEVKNFKSSRFYRVHKTISLFGFEVKLNLFEKLSQLETTKKFLIALHLTITSEFYLAASLPAAVLNYIVGAKQCLHHFRKKKC